MKNYIKIDKSILLDRIAKLEKPVAHYDGIYVSDDAIAQIELLEEILQQSEEYNENEAKLITPKQGSFDEDGFGITRVIDDKQETTTSWNEICNLYYNFREENNISHNDVESFEYWLANNYHPPVKK